MRTNAGKLLIGSMAVYLIVAACGSTERFLPDGGLLADGAAVVDSLSHPVPDAKADGSQSGSRLKVKYMAGADGSRVPYGGLRDSMLNVDCSFLPAVDGTMRCFPIGGASASSFFVDQNCTQLLAYIGKGCAKTPYATASAPSGGACTETRYRVFSVGAPFMGMTFYQLSNGICTGSPASNLSASYDLYAVGAEVPASTFVAGAWQTDP
jgi:hypothetical protein